MSKNNLKTFYKYANSSTGRTQHLVCIKCKLNSEFFIDREAANKFANFFHSTYVKDNGIFPRLPKALQRCT